MAVRSLAAQRRRFLLLLCWLGRPASLEAVELGEEVQQLGGYPVWLAAVVRGGMAGSSEDYPFRSGKYAGEAVERGGEVSGT